MYLLPPQPTNSEICISGDVEIHPSASIAPGVILQAAAQSRIVIGADVCLGMGVVISVDRGTVEIERGAALGSGVLVIGASKIGNNACVGTATTIFQVSVAAMAVIPPGSLIGDTSRRVEVAEPEAAKSTEPASKTQAKTPSNQKQRPAKKAQTYDRQNGSQPQPTDSENGKRTRATTSTTDTVVGKVYIDRLMMTLFPYKKSPNSDSSSDRNGTQP